MEQQKLQQYIYTSIQSGMDPDEITQQLRTAGWDEASISAAFTAVRNSITPQANETASPPNTQSHAVNLSGAADAQPSAETSDTDYSPIYEATGRRRGRIKSALLLMRQTIKLLWYNKRLFSYPFMGAIIVMFAAAITLTLLIQMSGFLATLDGAAEDIVFYSISFIYYTLIMFVIFLYNTALTAHLLELFKGQSRRRRDYLKIAWSKKGAIFVYSMITATVGILVSMLEQALQRLGFIGRLIIRAVGFTWELANTFTIPIIADTDTGGASAIKESVLLFRNRWGENLIGKVSFFGIAFLIYNVAFYFIWVALSYMLQFLNLLGLLTGFFSLFGFGIGIFLLLAFYLVPFLTIERALTNTLNAVLYSYAQTGQAPAAFTPEMLNATIVKKQPGRISKHIPGMG